MLQSEMNHCSGKVFHIFSSAAHHALRLRFPPFPRQNSCNRHDELDLEQEKPSCIVSDSYANILSPTSAATEKTATVTALHPCKKFWKVIPFSHQICSPPTATTPAERYLEPPWLENWSVACEGDRINGMQRCEAPHSQVGRLSSSKPPLFSLAGWTGRWCSCITVTREAEKYQLFLHTSRLPTNYEEIVALHTAAAQLPCKSGAVECVASYVCTGTFVLRCTLNASYISVTTRGNTAFILRLLSCCCWLVPPPAVVVVTGTERTPAEQGRRWWRRWRRLRKLKLRCKGRTLFCTVFPDMFNGMGRVLEHD